MTRGAGERGWLTMHLQRAALALLQCAFRNLRQGTRGHSQRIHRCCALGQLADRVHAEGLFVSSWYFETQSKTLGVEKHWSFKIDRLRLAR